MHVAFFTESYSPMVDGVAVEVGGLAAALARAGHEVTVFAPNPVAGPSTDRVAPDGVEVVRVRSIPVPKYAQYRWAVFPFPRLRGRGFRSGIDVVHLHTTGIMGGTGFLSARRFGKPLIGTFHTNVWAMRDTFGGDPLSELFFSAAKWFTLGTYYRCDVTTAPTESARRELERQSRRPFRRPIEVVPNGIELDRFHPGIERPDWRARCGFSDVPMITYLGRLTADKGVHRFLDALAAISDVPGWVASVAGVGPEEPTIRERIRAEPSLVDRVRFLGAVTELEKPALLAQSDVYVLPSTSDTSSLSVLEAMASGATCAVTSIGGPSNLVEDGRTGRSFDPTAPNQLPALLRELLDDSGLRRRLSAAALSQVRASASIDATARRFISLYELLLSEPRFGAAGNPR